MTSFCNCETCQRIKNQILERKEGLCCSFCGEIHPKYELSSGQLFCPLWGREMGLTPEIQPACFDSTTFPWATSKDIPDEKM